MTPVVGDWEVLDRLLGSVEPSVLWKTRVNVLGESRDSAAIRELETRVKESPRVRALTPGFAEEAAVGVYSKWQGSQWVLMALADIGYPRGEDDLRRAADEMVDQWLEPRFFDQFEAHRKSEVYAKLRTGVPLMEGRYRTCADRETAPRSDLSCNGTR